MYTFLKQINEGVHDMCYIWAKEMKSVVQDEGVLLFFIVVPILYPLLYSWVYNNEVVREVPVVVVDMSKSQLSRQFIRQYDASPDTKVAYKCNDMEEAKDLVEKQIAHGILYFPSDFETSVLRMEQSHVSVYCDMSLMLTYKAIYSTATAVSQSINSEMQIKLSGNYTNREDEITTKPLAVEEVQIFNATGGYGNFIIPPVLMLILQQTLLLGIGLSAGTARENNRYKDLVPISRHYNGLFRIVGGKSLCYFMIYSVMAAYVCLVVPRMFHYTSLANIWELIGVLVPYLLACIFFGMFVSCFVRYRENVILLVVFTSIPLLFLTGVSWPQSSIPGGWQGVSWIFPSTFGARAFVRMNMMDATLSDVRFEYQALWLHVVIYFFATCIVYRYQLLHTRHHALERLEEMKKKVATAKTKATES
jgi:ABC-2 type transport system permease protein